MSNILRNQICTQLTEARARTLELIAPLSEDDLLRQHDPLMSPILWDLGHIAHFEELWLVRNLEGPIEFSEMPGLYNPFENPRRVRGALALPTLEECRVLMREIRSRVLERMSHVRFDTDNELLRDGYVYSMVLQHEYQHNETILQTLQLKQGMPYRAPRAFSPPASRAVDRNASARFAGGRVRVGTNDRAVAYGNERPRHEIDLPPFSIDAFPASNGDYVEFMRAGGYDRREFWSEAGWAWRNESQVNAPKYWMPDGDGWCMRVMDRVTSVDPEL